LFFYEGGKIDKEYTVLKRFSSCSNSKCNSIYLIDNKKTFSEVDFLCSECAEKLNTHHIVQCRRCRAIIDFFPAEGGEEVTVFYTKKCHHCSGTFEDEKHIQPFLYPELFM
jgi:hypothetical protein